MKELGRKLVMTSLTAAVVAVFPASVALSNSPAERQLKKTALPAAQPMIHQLIVKLRNPTAAEKVSALGGTRMSALSKTAGVKLTAVRAMSGDASVVKLDAPMTLADAQAMAAQLAADPSVEYAEPDMPVKKFQVTPTDASFAGRQWTMQVPGTTFQSTINLQGGGMKAFTNGGGANFQSAWPTTQGANTVRVAVIDTGVTLNHPDIAAAIVPNSGYDFVSGNVAGLPANFVANDGDGRDADPTDPGDWVTAAEKAMYAASCDDGVAGDTTSSWHGTHMSGIVAAVWGGTAAGTSTAGAAPNVRIVPVRGLGKCGGLTSDIVDAMRWSAGLTVPMTPANPNPAKVLNLSLGGGAMCAMTTQTAVNEILAAGVVIVAATGNEGAAQVSSPASCTGVIAVTAHVINGENADYANIGPQVAVSAPGGGQGTMLAVPNLLVSDSAYFVWSTSLFGATTPTSAVSATDARTGPAIVGFIGTSPATPHVAATAALLFSLSPGLTPAAIRDLITNAQSVRPHPTGGFCLSAQGTGNCGAGLLDSGRAVTLHNTRRPTVNAGANQTVGGAAAVTLTGNGVGNSGNNTLTYAWIQTSGTAVTLNNANAASATFTAPGTDGALGFTLTVTDGNGYRNSSTTTVTVSGAGGGNPPPAPPPSGGDSGGSTPLWQLLLLAALGFAGRVRARR
jgi:serine protease